MRVRITFSKSGALIYIGHLDLNTVWERAARRAGLPLAYSQGFHPQPKITFASALPLGFSSRAEVLDMRLNQDPDLALLSTQLQDALPPGIGILKVENVDDHEPALQTQVVSAEYEVTLIKAGDRLSLQQKIGDLMAAQSLPRQRRGKTYDLRPLIEMLSLIPSPTPSGNVLRLLMRLAAREGATGRPEEVLDALDLSVENAHVERTRLLFKNQAW